jgi:hypothetical protein
MGVNPSTIKNQFQGVSKVSFAFQNVQRTWVDIGKLGQQLIGRSFDKSNPANHDFLYEELDCLLIDSIITSNNFIINVEQLSKEDFEINVAQIEQMLDLKNKVQVDQQSKRSISFSNKKALAFAFSCIRINLNQRGKIVFDTQVDQFFLDQRTKENENAVTPEHLLLAQEDMLFEIS